MGRQEGALGVGGRVEGKVSGVLGMAAMKYFGTTAFYSALSEALFLFLSSLGEAMALSLSFRNRYSGRHIHSANAMLFENVPFPHPCLFGSLCSAPETFVAVLRVKQTLTPSTALLTETSKIKSATLHPSASDGPQLTL